MRRTLIVCLCTSYFPVCRYVSPCPPFPWLKLYWCDNNHVDIACAKDSIVSPLRHRTARDGKPMTVSDRLGTTTRVLEFLVRVYGIETHLPCISHMWRLLRTSASLVLSFSLFVNICEHLYPRVHHSCDAVNTISNIVGPSTLL